jgi:hypothetical protein
LEDQLPSLNEFLASMPVNVTSVPLRSIASERPDLFARLRGFDPVYLAAIFGGLLAIPELQSNCIRLEALAHLSLAIGHGLREADPGLISELFGALDEGICGRCEAPAKDVFVSSIGTSRGNFRVLEGIWESAGFFLQRVVNAVEAMPEGSGYDDLRESIFGLLRLSDSVCERAGLARYQLGNDIPEKSLPDDIAGRIGFVQRLVRFSRQELSSLGISIDHLAAFGFVPDNRETLLDESIGHSSLERFPVLFRNGEFCLALPTAVSAAIRRYVIERMDAAGMREAFLRGLGREYAATFAHVPLLGGGVGVPVTFERTPTGMFACVMSKVEQGKFLNFVFLLDTLDQFQTGGLTGHNPGLEGPHADLGRLIDKACEAARSDEAFRDGITLLVSCGVGRAGGLSLKRLQRAGWGIEFISAADLFTLSWVRRFKPLSLWRLLQAEGKAESLGVILQNINGLLNMVAWARSLDGHVIPHAELPDDFLAEHTSAFIMVDQNGLRKLRHEVATNWDPHVEQDMQGRWIWVRRDAPSALEEDHELPLYAGEIKLPGGGPPAVYITPKRRWWGELEIPSGTSADISFQRWKMMTTWLARSAPVLNEAFPEIADGPIRWRARFEGPLGNFDRVPQRMTYAEARARLSVSAEAGGNDLTTSAAPAFERAHFNDDNIAERALVESLVDGVAALAGRELGDNERLRLVGAIVPDSRARHAHMFQTDAFRDYVQASLPQNPLTVDDMDAATLRLGLGWTVRDRSEGSLVEGKEACLAYLSALVKSVEEALCAWLATFDRAETLRLLLGNHEAAVVDRERWARTAAAVLSLAHDKMRAMDMMARHDFELNAIFQSTRLLSEIAICECPPTGGCHPSQSDLSLLMAMMMMAAQYGGWSDAIRWDVMEPQLKIRPLGDVHAKLGFEEEILAPFARATTDMRTEEAVKGYSSNLMSTNDGRSLEDVFEPQFLAAWRDEAGATLDEFLSFVGYVEQIGMDEGDAVLELPRSRFQTVALDKGSLPSETASAIIEFLMLSSRPKWREVPEGYEDADRQPWRFRRRLSVLRKPLLQIDRAGDPTTMVAPGILRDALIYMVGNYHRGDFPLRQLRRAMRSWAGTLRDQAGRQFSREVAARLKEFGWEAESEVKATKLLRRGFDRDYGDVDVLAWNRTSGRILIIECKDVQYRKIYGEIAEQLADFRGEVWPGGRRDYLLRHLDRVDVISQHLPAVAKYIRMVADRGIESHLVFKNPVPMEFALKHMAERVSVGIFDRLATI